MKQHIVLGWSQVAARDLQSFKERTHHFVDVEAERMVRKINMSRHCFRVDSNCGTYLGDRTEDESFQDIKDGCSNTITF